MSLGTVDPTDHQPGHPNLRGPRWKKGEPSPNPGGKSTYLRELEKAIQKQEPPALVCTVVAAMREDALAHAPYSAAAAKVYFGAVGVNLNREPPKIDLTKAPDEVVEWIAENAS